MSELAIPYLDAPLPPLSRDQRQKTKGKDALPDVVNRTSWWRNIDSMIAEGFSRATRLLTKDLEILPEDAVVRSLQPYQRDRQRIAHEAIRNERKGGSPDIRTIAYHVRASGLPEQTQRNILAHQTQELWVDEDGFTGSREVRELCKIFGIDPASRQPFAETPSEEMPASQQLFNAALEREAALSYYKTQIERIDEGETLLASQPKSRERFRRWLQTKKEERPWKHAPHVLDYFTQGMSPLLLQSISAGNKDRTYVSYPEMQAAAKELCYTQRPDVFHIAYLLRSSGAPESFVREHFVKAALPTYRDELFKQLATEFPDELDAMQTNLITLYHTRRGTYDMKTQRTAPQEIAQTTAITSDAPASELDGSSPVFEGDFDIPPHKLLKLLSQISPERRSGQVDLKAHKAFMLYTTYLHCADAYARNGGEGSPYIGDRVTAVMPVVAPLAQ